jgi:hypothetical protein
VTHQVLAYLAALAAGLGLGVLGRALLRGRIRLSLAEVLLAGIAGSVAGVLVAFVGSEIGYRLIVLSVVAALVVTVGILLVLERVQSARRGPSGSAADLVRGGEGAQVEFKSTARFNRHTGQRDEKLERVIAKTVCGFLNAEGGVLLIGVDDDGNALGLDEDLALMKHPDVDRYELWLRDMLVAAVGARATASVRVSFERVGEQQVCLVRVPAATQPVFVRPTKGDAAPTFVVRIGNSTRELPVDEALSYCADRFGRRALRGSVGR